MSFHIQNYQSPIGLLYLVANDTHLCGVLHPSNWPQFKPGFLDAKETETPLLRATKQQLHEYFLGARQHFDLPLAPQGTDFQKRVWSSLCTIPFGTTRSYKEQAMVLNAPKAARAVGRADALNPISIIIPCHRVIGSNGALTGYTGGLPAKEYLLALEAKAAKD